MAVRAEIVSEELLREDDRLRMLDLHRVYFDNVRRDVFLADMAAKDRVIVLRTPEGGIAGFSTLGLHRLRAGGRERAILFSGDTVVDARHRRCASLAGAFGHVMLSMLEAHPRTPCYWFLISKGYRTYRYLPLYFRRFYPNCAGPTPPSWAALLRGVGRRLFPGSYDAEAGIVRHAGIGDRLAPKANGIPAGREKDPHVAFFLARNPGYASGDELACIAEISRANFKPTCHRLIARTPVVWVGDNAWRVKSSVP